MSQNDFLRATARLVPFCSTTKCFLCLRGPGQAKKMKGMLQIN